MEDATRIVIAAMRRPVNNDGGSHYLRKVRDRFLSAPTVQGPMNSFDFIGGRLLLVLALLLAPYRCG